MTFSYRHRKLIVLLLLFLLSVTASFLIFRSHFTPKKKTSTKKIVLTPKKEETTTDKETYYLVDIKGAINNPGTYSMKKGSRVIDVIHLAGELKSDADTSVLNLSKKVTDEMVIIVYSYDEVKNFTKVKEEEKQEKDLSEEEYDIFGKVIEDNRKIKKINNMQKFEIQPVYINKNLINILVSGIFEIRMIHIINTICTMKKEGKGDKNERTSNRRAYDYSYE
mgnify:CR=1 FL=1